MFIELFCSLFASKCLSVCLLPRKEYHMSKDGSREAMFAISLDEANEIERKKEIKEIEETFKQYFLWKRILSALMFCCFFPPLRDDFFKTEEEDGGPEKRAQEHLRNLRLELQGISDADNDGLL